MRNKLVLILLLCCVLLPVRAAELQTVADSLNYAVGLHNGLQIRSQYPQIKQDEKARNLFIQAMDQAFASGSMPDEMQRVGQEVAVMFASQREMGLAQVRGWLYQSDICLQGLANGLLGDTAWKSSDAMGFFQAAYMHLTDAETKAEQVPAEKKASLAVPKKVGVQKLKTRNDSLNYAFGLINGDQLRSLASDAEKQQQLIAEINKSLAAYNNYSRIELIGSSVGYGLIGQKTSGFLGMQGLPLEYEILKKGLSDGLNGDETLFSLQTVEPYINAVMMKLQSRLQAQLGEKVRREGEAFLAANAKRPEVKTTSSGLQYEVLRQGEGTVHPTASSTVRVHYHGTLIDGTVFDSSVERGEPISFPLDGVIRGWTEGVQLMTEGAKFRFYIPYLLGYGERGAGANIPPFATLIFDVELLKIEK